MLDPDKDNGAQEPGSGIESKLFSAGALISGRYKILELLGRGGMAVVYKAEDSFVNRIVALKTLRPDLVTAESLKRFQNEAKILAAMDHPNIVPVFNFGTDNEMPFIVMGFVDGQILSDVLQTQKLDESQIIKIILQLADALQHAHELGIVHRDVKPGNVVFDSAEHVMLMDFGISKLVEGDTERVKLTQSGSFIGSPFYTAPEQCLGKGLDARSDIYSLSCLAYELVSGSPPFIGGNAFETFNLHVTAIAKPLTACSKKLRAVIEKGMDKRPEARFQSARELAEFLRSDEKTLANQGRKHFGIEFASITALAIFSAIIAIVFADPFNFGLFQDPAQRALKLLSLGEKAYLQKDYSSAESNFSKAIQISEAKSLSLNLIPAYLGMCKVSLQKREYGLARSFAKTALSKALALKEKTALKGNYATEARLLLSETYLQGKKYDYWTILDLLEAVVSEKEIARAILVLKSAEPVFMRAPAEAKARFCRVYAMCCLDQLQYANAEKYSRLECDSYISPVDKCTGREFLCQVLEAQGKYVEAEKYRRQVLDYLNASTSTSVLLLAAQYQKFGNNLRLQQKYTEAASALRQALAIYKTLPNVFEYAETLIAISEVLDLQGQTKEALEILTNDPHCATSALASAICKLRKGLILTKHSDFTGAEAEFRAVVEKAAGLHEGRFYVAIARMQLGSIVSRRGEHKEAKEFYIAALPALYSAAPNAEAETACTELWLCRECQRLAEYSEAVKFGLAGASTLYRLKVESAEFGAGLWFLSKSLYSLGRYAEGTDYARQSVKMLKKYGGKKIAESVLSDLRAQLEADKDKSPEAKRCISLLEK